MKCSQSHHYAQLGNALQNHFFAYSALIMDTLKGPTDQFFNFIAHGQYLTGALNGPDLPKSSHTAKNQCQ